MLMMMVVIEVIIGSIMMRWLTTLRVIIPMMILVTMMVDDDNDNDNDND